MVTLQNGIPWWFFYQWGGAYEGRPVRSVDPEGAIATYIENERIVGTVVYFASEVIAPGVVRVIEGNRLALGRAEPANLGAMPTLVRRFPAAGFKAPIVGDIRGEIWLKLWGNMVFNPISALTHATLVGHMPISANPQSGRGHDGRSPGDCGKAGHTDPARH